MTCKFTPWILSKNHAEHISRTLLETNNEIAGAVIFDKQTTSSSKIIFTEHGKQDSVRISLQKNHMLSFHTHPAIAYRQAGCVYGHPSGDDIREYLKLCMDGALNHAVFTLEGVYIIQIHPLMVTFMLKLNRKQRDKILNYIFAYFREFHGKRTYANVKATKYTPREFVKECNGFSLLNLKSNSNFHDFPTFPNRILCCVWFFSDNFKKYENDIDSLWYEIQRNSLQVTFNNLHIPISFSFLMLRPIDRTLSNVLINVKDCVQSAAHAA